MYYRTPDDRRRVRYPSDDVAVPENYGGNVFHTSGGKTTFSPLEEQVTPAGVSPGEAERADGMGSSPAGPDGRTDGSDGTDSGSDNRDMGTSGAERATGQYDMGQGNGFTDGPGGDRGMWQSGGGADEADSYGADYGENRSFPGSGAEPWGAGRAAEGARERGGSRPTAAHGDGGSGAWEAPGFGYDAPGQSGSGCTDPGDSGTSRKGVDCTENGDAIAGEPLPRSLPKTPGFLEHFSLPHALGSEELLLLGLMYLTAQKPGDDLWIYLLVLLFCG